jgi:hypothetical protein
LAFKPMASVQTRGLGHSDPVQSGAQYFASPLHELVRVSGQTQVYPLAQSEAAVQVLHSSVTGTVQVPSLHVPEQQSDVSPQVPPGALQAQVPLVHVPV